MMLTTISLTFTLPKQNKNGSNICIELTYHERNDQVLSNGISNHTNSKNINEYGGFR